jgi:membrane-bound serine protease (ClpP class)
MAPATNLGSATPVAIGGEPPTPAPKDDGKGDAKKPADEAQPQPSPGGKMERKVENDAVAYLRSLAQLRGRNVEWAEKAVREGANLAASDALEQKVIDLIATDQADLLAKLDGRKVTINSAEVTLATQGPGHRDRRAGLAHGAVVRHYQSDGGLRAPADRHLWAAVRRL